MLGIAKHAGTGAWSGGAPAAQFLPNLAITPEIWRSFNSANIGYVTDSSTNAALWVHTNFTPSTYSYSGSSVGKAAASMCRYVPTGFYASYATNNPTGQALYEGGNFVFQLWNPNDQSYGYFLAGTAFAAADYQTATSTPWRFALECSNQQSSIWVSDYTGLSFTPAEVEGVWTTWQFSVSDNKADFAGFLDPAQPTPNDAQAIYVRYRMYNSIIGERIQDRVMWVSSKSAWLSAGGLGINKPATDSLSGQMFPLGDMRWDNIGNKSTNCWQILGDAVDWKSQGSQFHTSTGKPVRFSASGALTTSGGSKSPSIYTSMTKVNSPTWVSNESGGTPAVATINPDVYTAFTGAAIPIELKIIGLTSSTWQGKLFGTNPYGA